MKNRNKSPFAEGEVTGVEVCITNGGEKDQARASAMASEIGYFLEGTEKERNELVDMLRSFPVETLEPLRVFFAACYLMRQHGYSVRYDIKPAKLKKNCETVAILKHGNP